MSSDVFIIQVNECRKQLFTKKDRSLDSIPPTADARIQHVKRATYQGKLNCDAIDVCIHLELTYAYNLAANFQRAYSSL